MLPNPLTLLLAAVAITLPALTMGQAGPNTLNQYHPREMTMSSNGTTIILPLPIDLVKQLVGGKDLVSFPPPDFPEEYFVDGVTWPPNTHPVLFAGYYSGDIRQLGLYIDFLLNSRIEVPCVDQLRDSRTCFRYAVANYIGGLNGQLYSSLVPALVATLEGQTVLQGAFDPPNRNLKPLANGQFSFLTQKLILPNPFSGPGVGPPAFQFVIRKVAEAALFTARGFKNLINQPIITNDGLRCVRSTTYFNESFAQPFFCNADDVTVFEYLLQLNGVPRELEGGYTSAACFSGNGVNVGYPPQSCEDAIRDLDPEASM